jgi:hypothetical protein
MPDPHFTIRLRAMPSLDAFAEVHTGESDDMQMNHTKVRLYARTQTRVR